MTTFTVTIKATSITVEPGNEALPLLEPLFNSLTYEDEFTEEIHTLGILYDDDTDILYIHKGVDIEYLRRLLSNIRIVKDLYHSYKEMEFEYEEIIAPRDEDQVDVINFISGMNHHASNVNDSQIFLVKNPGFGKTYCSGVGLCKYHLKTLIIMHRDTLRNQWHNSLYNMSGLSNKYVHEIKDSEELYNIAHGNFDFDYDVYLMTHATFRAGIRRIQNMKFISKITENLKIGFKIIDEAHLEFKNTLMIDMCFNVKRNLYLTATKGRSGKEENAIFNHVFSDATYYKKSSMLTMNTPKKWVEYFVIEVNTNCKPNIYRYRVAGGKGMNPASYGKWVIAYDKNKIHFKCIKELVKSTYDDNPHAKMILFMPLIDLCEECAYFLTTELDKDAQFKYNLDIRTINSKNTKTDNLNNKKADVIITTIASCGTGTDIPGITDIISCSPFTSKITAEQVFGRIRYCGRVCHYYDIYDSSVLMDRIWLKSRMKTIRPLALNCKLLSWQEDRNSSD